MCVTTSSQIRSTSEDIFTIDALTADYKAFVQVPLETNIKKYRADYLLSDGPLQEHLRRALPNLTLATTTQGYYLYTFPEAR
ncbi:MAG: hypothetical protein UY74_C0031G0004 [Candidatus Kaiserbacteria bacterium GW2011_GWC2_52_8b]|uniref:Uncharacterized protein n=1 Tax=Candidatus Kaiserbacteria bacterium GW2011_GWC2_52_8b TaxID=1618676 RepID=A0A0G1XIM9_9BACT|nr:MAG: hypothetical protein UY74_C0031G0004 [Candidatus Kaiserbacteria bacterium GW2011_GWC2_52_8b]